MPDETDDMTAEEWFADWLLRRRCLSDALTHLDCVDAAHAVDEAQILFDYITYGVTPGDDFEHGLDDDEDGA